MEPKLGLGLLMGCLMLSASTLMVAGCGDDSTKGDGGQSEASGGAGASEAGAGSRARAEGGADAASANGGVDSGHGGSGNDTGSGARPNVDPGGPMMPEPPGAGGSGDGGEDSPDFDGIDLSDVSPDAPSGCVGGFDPATGTLAISIDDQAPVVRLAVHAGVVQANGVDCESGAGDPAKADQVLSLAVSGGAGDDAVYLDSSDEAFSGCISDAGSIRIDLGEGNDRVSVLGTSRADVIHAGSEDDQLVVDLSGDDRVDLTISGAPAVVISTGAKGDEVRADGAALGAAPAALALALYGGGSRDVLVGGAMADQLFGGIGNDWFDAGTGPLGADHIDGGEGSDTIDFSARTAPLTITLGAGADDGEAGEKLDVADSVENVYGGQAENAISGGAADNWIWGGPEADVLDGGAGSDYLMGGAGNDQLSGGADADFLYGEDGDDALDGGAGDDLLNDVDGKNTLNGGPGDGDICIPTQLEKAAGCEL